MLDVASWQMLSCLVVRYTGIVVSHGHGLTTASVSTCWFPGARCRSTGFHHLMAGGGVALLYASKGLDEVLDRAENFDQKIGVQLLQASCALSCPIRQSETIAQTQQHASRTRPLSHFDYDNSRRPWRCSPSLREVDVVQAMHEWQAPARVGSPDLLNNRVRLRRRRCGCRQRPLPITRESRAQSSLASCWRATRRQTTDTMRPRVCTHLAHSQLYGVRIGAECSQVGRAGVLLQSVCPSSRGASRVFLE